MTAAAPATAYRPDVDGLRAFAVTTVILYHLSSKILPGGFIGVDVFFVISGFVVTGAVIRAESSSAWRDLLHFWRRRWLRIVPPLITCVLISTVAFALLFAPVPRESYVGTIRTGLAASLGLGNLYLYRIALDYFQADQSINLFSHTWSLGVEEQFYLAFSLVIILLVRVTFPSRRVIARMIILATVTFTSLALFVWRASSDPIANYYFLSSRLWELGIGCMIACWRSPIPDRRSGKAINGAQLLAAAMLIGSAIYSTPTTKFPAGQIIAAVAGAAILIGSGSISRGIIARVLENRTIVFVGLISYSLYLWHWPVLVTFRYTVGLRSPVNAVIALSIIFALAYLSYRFVEQKTRRRTEPFIGPLLGAFVTAFAVVFGTGYLLSARAGLIYTGSKQDWNAEWLPPVQFAYASPDRIDQTSCLLHDGSIVPERIPERCVAPADPDLQKQRLILVGDSHAFADWGMVGYAADRGYMTVSTLVHDGCSANGSPSEMSPSCVTYWQSVPRLVSRETRPGDLVLVSFLWFYYPGASFSNGITRLRAIADAADSTGATLIVEAPLPHFERPSFMCTREWYRTDYHGCSTPRQKFESDRRSALTALKDFTEERNNVAVWDPTPFLCSETCDQVRGTSVIFRDANHISYAASRALGAPFVKFLQTIP